MRDLLCIVSSLAILLRASVAFCADPVPASAQVVISEFLTSSQNEQGIRDEDGALEEWIEIHNRGSEIVNLGGWALTDDPSDTNKWRFPNRILAPNEYLVIFASAKNRTNGPQLHTNFKLSLSGEYLALFDPAGTPATRFSPKYPEQRNDISFGLLGTNCTHLSPPTPGNPNASAVTYGGIVAAPQFSVQSGFFQNPFTLTLFCETPNSSLRYTLDGSEPSQSS